MISRQRIAVDYRRQVSTSSHGAYGFRLSGLDDALDWLNPAPDDWPTVEVKQEVAPPDESSRFDEEVRAFPLMGGYRLEVMRAERRVLFSGPEPLSSPALIHPFLAPAASVLCRWEDWPPFHAGAFVVNGEAWALTADRNGGKSTTLAALAESGVPVLTDDLVVLKESHVAAGPRSVDLRDPRDFSDVEYLGELGRRERWRKQLAPVPAEVPVAGVIQLVWSDAPGVHWVSMEEKPEIIKEGLSYSASGRAMLDVLRLPMVRVGRPRGELTETIDLVLEAVRA